MVKNFITLAIVTIALSCSSQHKYPATPKSTNDATLLGNLIYPHNFTYEGNPVSHLHGAADPDVHVWDNEVWVYCSQDRKIDSSKHKHHYDAMDGYHAFSTKDMVNWTDHGEIFHSSDVPWAWEKGGFLWAPGATRKDGKYYLYYPIKNKIGKWCVGVATGKTPIGPFEDTGHPIEGLNDIDPAIFIDDDGQAYIYNNPGIMAKLKPNMIELAEPIRKIEYASNDIMTCDTLKFLEGAYMHKKDGVYYFSYTNWKNKENQGFYATANNPYGPFEWKGAMAPKPQGAQDHHSIIQFKGQWYYFYHVSIHKFPQYREGQSRILCFDKLFYNKDGSIQQVIHTMQ